jgi:hypothetical protein
VQTSSERGIQSNRPTRQPNATVGAPTSPTPGPAHTPRPTTCTTCHVDASSLQGAHVPFSRCRLAAPTRCQPWSGQWVAGPQRVRQTRPAISYLTVTSVAPGGTTLPNHSVPSMLAPEPKSVDSPTGSPASRVAAALLNAGLLTRTPSANARIMNGLRNESLESNVTETTMAPRVAPLEPAWTRSAQVEKGEGGGLGVETVDNATHTHWPTQPHSHHTHAPHTLAPQAAATHVRPSCMLGAWQRSS